MRFFPTFMVFAVILSYSAEDKAIYAVGNIFDETSGEPISFVEVYARSGKKLGKANSKGRFEIELEDRNMILVFRKHGYVDSELDLSETPDLIDLEVSMESRIKELPEMRVHDSRQQKKQHFKNQSIEELEQFQGLRIDLNDHLRSLEGVSGMKEYSSDISIYGGRTEDVTHYLGGAKITNMRHLDFGFPGSQSALNPRLLKSVSVEDNPYSGPLNQGNSSALKYELKEGDLETISGDVVFGTINREVNLMGYWGNTTLIASYRNLFPNFLANLGKQFFTLPKESRLGNCPEGVQCKKLPEPIYIRSEDWMVSVFKRDTIGGYFRFLYLGVEDTFNIEEDISPDLTSTKKQAVQDGDQHNHFLSIDKLSPRESGDIEYSLGAMWEGRITKARDTTGRYLDFYGGNRYNQDNSNIMGLSKKNEYTLNGNLQWNSNQTLLGADYAYGLETEYIIAGGEYRDSTSNATDLDNIGYFVNRAMLRLGWETEARHSLETSVGGYMVDVDDIRPVASARYTIPFAKNHSCFGEIALRQNTKTQSMETNQISAYTTGSGEGKLGLTGTLGSYFSYGGTVYSRYYLEPSLPYPDVYWHYRELRSADYAAVFGASLSFRWEPSHHFGFNFNGSSVQGDYYLTDGDAIPWESNRTLDFVSNLRLVPRKDSLLSAIITYTVSNDAPLYEYRMPLRSVPRNDGSGRVDRNRDDRTRRIAQSKEYPTVSRQRLDARINLDLTSKWKGLETVRFFFQGNNLFADADSEYLNWLGGQNRKQRGWTRVSRTRSGNLVTDSEGNYLNNYLTPVLIRGMGFFWLFGFEMHFGI